VVRWLLTSLERALSGTATRYSTAAALNSYTPLIHEKYTAVAANPASVVHLTLDPASFQYVAYTAQPHLGRPNAIFAPLRTELRVDEAERAGCED
jgi:hypothetical protein